MLFSDLYTQDITCDSTLTHTNNNDNNRNNKIIFSSAFIQKLFKACFKYVPIGGLCLEFCIVPGASLILDNFLAAVFVLFPFFILILLCKLLIPYWSHWTNLMISWTGKRKLWVHMGALVMSYPNSMQNINIYILAWQLLQWYPNFSTCSLYFLILATTNVILYLNIRRTASSTVFRAGYFHHIHFFRQFSSSEVIEYSPVFQNWYSLLPKSLIMSSPSSSGFHIYILEKERKGR